MMKPFTIRLLCYSFVAMMIAAVVIVLVAFPLTGGASPQLTQTPSATPSDRVHLPLVRYDALATPPPTPTNPSYSAAAALYVTPFTDILASTFNTGSFVVANDSLGGERLTELRIDLSAALFPDMVFDPFGAAGDTVAKNVTVDVREGLNFDGWTYEGEHDGGFDVLVLRFSNFDRGDRFEFSVDVDPTSIQGVSAPGPFASGSVGGLELVGATITATFDDGTALVNQTYRIDDPGSAGAHSGTVAFLRPGLPERPEIELPGVSAPAVVNDPNQTIRVSGPAGRPVIVVVVEGGLFTEGLPSGGFDLDPFEANSAVAVTEYNGVIGPAGTVDMPVTLSRSLPEGGINVISATFDNHYGVRGLVADPLTLELE
jgi:hypothetical protein